MRRRARGVERRTTGAVVAGSNPYDGQDSLAISTFLNAARTLECDDSRKNLNQNRCKTNQCKSPSTVKNTKYRCNRQPTSMKGLKHSQEARTTKCYTHN